MFYPVKLFADWLTFNVLKIGHSTLLAEAINFFIFDTIKILILLVVIIFIVSFIRTYLSPERIRSILSRKHQFTGNILASLLGIVTPFCTCSAIPLFLGFVEAGIPLGITFSFLIASPMINEVALVLLAGMFGLKIALIYIASGLLIAIISGLIIGKLKVESLVEKFVYEHKISTKLNEQEKTLRERAKYAKFYTLDIIKKVYPYILVGIAIGAFIHGYVPTDFLARYAGSDKWYAVPLATLIGIPLYSNAAGVIPLISALTEKGVAVGTALAFMMAITGLSLPEFLILKKVMKPKLVLIFAVIVGLGIIFTGYLFNLILG
ncbi:MAG: permease [Patescibacteria group bacterium]